MANPGYLVDSILHVMQEVADLLVTGVLTTTEAQDLLIAVEGLRGSIQALPLNSTIKTDLLHRLDTVETLLSDYIAGVGLPLAELLTAVLGLLELLKEKILVLKLKPCIGTLTVCFPPPFSTACNCC